MLKCSLFYNYLIVNKVNKILNSVLDLVTMHSFSPIETSTRVVWEMECGKIKTDHHITTFQHDFSTASQFCYFDWFNFSYHVEASVSVTFTTVPPYQQIGMEHLNRLESGTPSPLFCWEFKNESRVFFEKKPQTVKWMLQFLIERQL